jgi:hypothetical protein
VKLNQQPSQPSTCPSFFLYDRQAGPLVGLSILLSSSFVCTRSSHAACVRTRWDGRRCTGTHTEPCRIATGHPRAHLWNPRGGPQDCSHVAAMAQAPWMAVGQIHPCVECAASYKNHPCPNLSYPLHHRRPGDSFPQILYHQSIETKKEKKGGEEIEGGGGDPGAEGAAARNTVDGHEEGCHLGGRSRTTVRLRTARHRNAVTLSRHWRPWNAESC